MMVHAWTLLVVAVLVQGPDVETPAPRVVTSFAVVVNTRNTTVDLSVASLRRILKGETSRWNDGTRIQLLVPREKTPEGKVLIRKVYKTRIDRHFRKMRFRNRSNKAPKSRAAAAALREVASSPGAIAVVPADLVRSRKDVRVLTIGNRKPGATGYFLNTKSKFKPIPIPAPGRTKKEKRS